MAMVAMELLCRFILAMTSPVQSIATGDLGRPGLSAPNRVGRRGRLPPMEPMPPSVLKPGKGLLKFLLLTTAKSARENMPNLGFVSPMNAKVSSWPLRNVNMMQITSEKMHLLLFQ